MVGMADGYAQASGQHHGRQPPHRARRRQRDGGDLQRPGQPLAAADHRRPAGAGPDHPAGQPDQPRRDPDAAPAGQVVLRAGRGPRTCRWPSPTAPTSPALPPQGPVFVSLPMDDWDAEVDEADAARRDRPQGRRPRRRRPRGGPRPRRAPRRRHQPGPRRRPRHRRQRRLGRRRSPSPSASACRSGRRPATGGGRLGFPENHPNFRGVLPPAIGPVGQTLEGHDLILVVGSSVFPYYPYIPGPLLPEGAKLVAITSDPDEAARAPMGDAIVADVKLTLEALLEAVPESSRPAPEPNPGPQEIPATDPLNSSTVHSALAEVLPEDAIVVLESPSSTLALRNQLRLSRPGQLLLQRRRRPRLRPRRLGRRPARPARPPGRLRARRGLGPVRDHRLLERRRLRGPGHLPRPAQLGVRDPQVVRRGRAGDRRPRPRPAGARRRRGRRRLRRQRPPGRATATRSATRSRRRSPPRSRSWSKSRSRPGMSLF